MGRYSCNGHATLASLIFKCLRLLTMSRDAVWHNRQIHILETCLGVSGNRAARLRYHTGITSRVTQDPPEIAGGESRLSSTRKSLGSAWFKPVQAERMKYPVIQTIY